MPCVVDVLRDAQVSVLAGHVGGGPEAAAAHQAEALADVLDLRIVTGVERSLDDSRGGPARRGHAIHGVTESQEHRVTLGEGTQPPGRPGARSVRASLAGGPCLSPPLWVGPAPPERATVLRPPPASSTECWTDDGCPEGYSALDPSSGRTDSAHIGADGEAVGLRAAAATLCMASAFRRRRRRSPKYTRRRKVAAT